MTQKREDCVGMVTNLYESAGILFKSLAPREYRFILKTQNNSQRGWGMFDKGPCTLIVPLHKDKPLRKLHRIKRLPNYNLC